MPAQPIRLLNRVLAMTRVDFSPAHRQPSAVRVILALAVALAAPRWLFFRLADRLPVPKADCYAGRES